MTTVLLSRDNKDITKFGLICASPRQHVHAIKQIRKARTIIWRHNKLVDHLGSRSDIQQSSTSHRDVSFCGGLFIAKGSFSRTFYRVAECTKEKKGIWDMFLSFLRIYAPALSCTTKNPDATCTSGSEKAYFWTPFPCPIVSQKHGPMLWAAAAAVVV